MSTKQPVFVFKCSQSLLPNINGIDRIVFYIWAQTQNVATNMNSLYVTCMFNVMRPSLKTGIKRKKSETHD